MGYVKCQDHLGNWYSSISEMCNKYNIPKNLWKSRRRMGWDVEKTLTTPYSIHMQEIKDHLGNEFNTVMDMCEYWGLKQSLYYYRKQKGYTLEEILTGKCNIVTDHLGNEFRSITEMCEYWGLSENKYHTRRKYGYTLEEILTGKLKICNYIDPITNNKVRLNDLIEKYNLNISQRILYRRLDKYSVISSIGISMMLPKILININRTKYNLTVAKRIKKGKDVFECYIDNGDGTSTFKIMTYDMIDQYCLEQYKKLHNIT